ncbi:hypothetical protein KP509_02G096600 [Ceratopteris richardii]|uniref:Uncharacterized protein n=1 Tax=Ceratopteris richardii TaxID=49495 RepID=A0A8T2V8X9_CERRI|nr:hypothetical protein KP509_02G096600 [Ceratopteris richardii]
MQEVVGKVKGGVLNLQGRVAMMGSPGATLAGASQCTAAAPTFLVPRLHFPTRVHRAQHRLHIRCCNPMNPASEPDASSGRPHRRSSPKESLPRGFRRYETTAVLRPDITEEERLEWTQRYDEALVASGAISVEFSNRGILPLTYSIKKKDMGGVTRTYLDGVYMNISYITKPQCQLDLQRKFNMDDDVVRTITMLLQ